MAAKDTAPPPVKEAPLPIDAVRQEVEILKLEIAELQKQVERLTAREAKHWKITENFLSKFGTYYDTTRQQQALFIIGQFTRGGVNGLALTPQQGMIEQFDLPMRLSVKDGERITGPIMIPVIIPEQAEEELIELFEAGADDGTDNKAVS
jgi:hypothetical protein